MLENCIFECVNIINPKTYNDIINEAMKVFSWDLDFVGDNGADYVSDVALALGYTSNMDFALSVLQDKYRSDDLSIITSAAGRLNLVADIFNGMLDLYTALSTSVEVEKHSVRKCYPVKIGEEKLEMYTIQVVFTYG